jgi:hypothetical protein
MPQDALFIHLILGLLISQISSLLDKYPVCSPPLAAMQRQENGKAPCTLLSQTAEGEQTHVRDSKNPVMGSR